VTRAGREDQDPVRMRVRVSLTHLWSVYSYPSREKRILEERDEILETADSAPSDPERLLVPF
jgi:ribosomal protein S12